jgi:NDP-sugar pyrophosphorylase family protein
MDHMLRWLASQGVTEVFVNLHHLGDQIRSFVGNGRRFGLSVSYSREETLLGTAGAAKRLECYLCETFAVAYGDVLTNMRLAEMAAWHCQRGGPATIAVLEADDTEGRGVVDADDKGRVLSFVEKPPVAAGRCLINAGIYILEPRVLSFIEPGFCDFGVDVFPKLIRAGIPIFAWRLRPSEYLLDIGTPEAYQLANKDALAGRFQIGSPSFAD